MNKNIIKISVLGFAVAVLMSSCGTGTAVPDFDPEQSEVKVTLDQLYEINKLENILDRHENCYATVELKKQPYTGFGVFQTNDIFFYEYFNPQPDTWQAAAYFDGGQWFMRYGDDALPILSYCWYPMSDEEKYETRFKPGRCEFFSDYTVNDQKIINIELDTEGDGQARIYTRSADSVAGDLMETYNLHNTQFWFSKDEHRYTVFPDTLELEYNKNYLRLQSGKVYTYYHSYLQYDVNEPDFMKMVMAVADTVMNDDSAEMKTLTAIYDPGTAEEQTYTMQYNGKYAVTVSGRDGYSAFTDAGGQSPFDGNVPYDDMTIYFLKK